MDTRLFISFSATKEFEECDYYFKTIVRQAILATLEFEDFYFLCVYTPNAQRELARLDYRMAWEDALRGYIMKLDEKKPVIYCGDLNVAHEEIDLKNPKTNHHSAGFSDEERAKFSELLQSGFCISFGFGTVGLVFL